MTTVPQLTPQGLVVPTQDQCFADLKAAMQAQFGANMTFKTGSPEAIIFNILASVFASQYEAQQEVYDSFNADNAEGKALDDICALNSIFRLQPAASTMYVACSGTIGTVIPTGALAQIQVPFNNAIFQNVLSFTISLSFVNSITSKINSPVVSGFAYFATVNGITASFTATGTSTTTDVINGLITSLTAQTPDYTITQVVGTIDQYVLACLNVLQNVVMAVDSNQTIQKGVSVAQFACTATGPTDAPEGALTITAGVGGWATATNVSVTALGRLMETDTELRIRRGLSLAIIGQSTLEALQAKLTQLTGVTAPKVYENTSLTTDSNGIPGKAFLCVLQGGSDNDIANTIWNNKPAGIEDYGGPTPSSVTIYDSEGFPHVIQFARPAAIPVLIKVNFTIDPDYWTVAPTPTQIDTIKSGIISAIYKYGLTLNTGQDVIAQKFIGPIFSSVLGILNLAFELRKLVSDPPSQVIVISILQVAYITPVNITVNQV